MRIPGDERAMVLTPRLAVRLHEGDDPHALAARWGVTLVRRIDYGQNLCLFEAASGMRALQIANEAFEQGIVAGAQPMLAREMTLRLPDDPLYPGRQIWLYYTHMADKSGEQDFIEDAFPPGT